MNTDVFRNESNSVFKLYSQVLLAHMTFPDAVCSLHRQEVKLFCQDDGELLCYECLNSEIHKNHNFRPISTQTLALKVSVLPCFDVYLFHVDKVFLLWVS